VICDYALDLASLAKRSFCVPACQKQAAIQIAACGLQLNLLFFFILIIFPSSLTFHLPYFVILWSPPGGNFCAGYDLKELANHTASLKLEQDVTKGPGPMVSAVCVCVLVRVTSIFPYTLTGGLVFFYKNIKPENVMTNDCEYL